MTRDAVVVAMATFAVAAALALRGSVNVWLGTAVAAAIGVAGSVAVARGRLEPWLRPTRSTGVVGFVVGVAMILATHLLYLPARALVAGLAPRVSDLYTLLEAPPGPAAALPVVLLVVTAEELVWRGLAVDLLQARNLRPVTVVAVATLLYALPQIAGGGPVLVVVTLSAGLVWTVLRVVTGSLVAPFITHLVWDVGVFVLWPVA